MPGVFNTLILCLAAKPDLGLIWISNSTGNATEIPVGTKWDVRGLRFIGFLINNKDRIAQMILTPVIKMSLEETDSLPETVRGDGGFGSTGKWFQN